MGGVIVTNGASLNETRFRGQAGGCGVSGFLPRFVFFGMAEATAGGIGGFLIPESGYFRRDPCAGTTSDEDKNDT